MTNLLVYAFKVIQLPIIIIICYACSDGMGRTGTFITIFSQLERIKTESICDVFQCIKAMRLQRPCMVENAVRTLTQML